MREREREREIQQSDHDDCQKSLPRACDKNVGLKVSCNAYACSGFNCHGSKNKVAGNRLLTASLHHVVNTIGLTVNTVILFTIFSNKIAWKALFVSFKSLQSSHYMEVPYC